MDNEQQEFERNLEKLIRLFRKIKERGDVPGTGTGMDEDMRRSMDFLIENFEAMKNDPSASETMKNIGLPFGQMLSGMIRNLSEQLGEDPDKLLEEEEGTEAANEPVVKEDSPVNIGVFTRRLVQIDSLLAKGNLPEEEVDALLDERFRIIEKLNSGAE